MARQSKPILPSLTAMVTGAMLKSFLDWVDTTLDAKPSADLEIVEISTSTYTLTQYDQGKYLRFTQACTITVPAAGDVPLAPGSPVRGSFRAGAPFHFRATAGVLTFSAATGVTVTPPTGANANTRDAIGGAMLVCVTSAEALKDSTGSVLVAPNAFDLLGDLEVP